MLELDKTLLIASLADELLNELSPLNSFMRPKEYKKIYEYSKNWKSRNWFLNKNFYTTIGINMEDDQLDFLIKLYALEKSSCLSDAFAIIPFEFQYIKMEESYDVIILRMFLDSSSFRIATIEVTKDVYSSIQEHFQNIQKQHSEESPSNVFDLACFQCIQEYSERIFRNKGEFYESWEIFKKEWEKQNSNIIKEYSDVGKYLWQASYLCFDNRFKKGDKVTTILEQYEENKKRKLMEDKTPTKKKGISSIKSLFIDEFGNYWKNEKAYLNYKKDCI